MTGSLQTRGNYYYAVLECKDIYGKRKQKWISLKIKVQGNNKRKAKKKLNELIQQYEEREITNDYADIYFEIYMQKWLERKKMSVELSTWEGYEYHLKHIVEYFSGKKLNSQHSNQYISKNIMIISCDMVIQGNVLGQIAGYQPGQ